MTNYFKFMKWCFWLFVTLTILCIPVLVLNVSGDYKANKGLKSIAQTTIGMRLCDLYVLHPPFTLPTPLFSSQATWRATRRTARRTSPCLAATTTGSTPSAVR
ncbi:hypothetical protein EON64_08490 [archaeon]|nr:MAG: hypothetical protein EON64_08490 [archaeon]